MTFQQDAYNDLPDPFPTTNRATRRHCKHLWKTIGDHTACVDCGKTLNREPEGTDCG